MNESLKCVYVSFRALIIFITLFTFVATTYVDSYFGIILVNGLF